MNRHTQFAANSAQQDELACIHELLVVPLAMIDQLGLPAIVGAQLDHSLQTLRQHLGAEYALMTTASPDWTDA
jgi:hypothetical protein